MSDTPRTDEFIFCAVRTDHNWRTFARQLERELAKWQAEAARLSAEREHNANMAGMWQSVAAGLADALRCISAHDGPGFPHGTCCNIAGQALAAYETAKAGGPAKEGKL